MGGVNFAGEIEWNQMLIWYLWNLTSKIFPCGDIVKYIYCFSGILKFAASIKWSMLFNKSLFSSKVLLVGHGFFLFITPKISTTNIYT